MHDFATLRGANYVASYAVDVADMWRRFNREIVDFELGLAKDLGLNAIRVWLSPEPYFEDRHLFLAAFTDFIDMAGKADLGVIPILFDGCGAAPEPGNNARVTIQQRFERFLRNDAHSAELRQFGKALLGEYATGPARAALCQAGGSDTAIFWGEWKPSPGYDRLTPSNYETFYPYVDALIDAHKSDSRIVLWDIMNEPWVYDLFYQDPDDPLPGQFAAHFCDYVQSKNCGIPITVGCSRIEFSLRLRRQVDVLSYHTYEPAQGVRARVDEARHVAKNEGKPALLTECLAVLPTVPQVTMHLGEHPYGDEGQLAYVKQVFPVIEQSKAGWFLFSLVTGRIPFFYTGFYHPSGVARPAAQWLRNRLATS